MEKETNLEAYERGYEEGIKEYPSSKKIALKNQKERIEELLEDFEIKVQGRILSEVTHEIIIELVREDFKKLKDDLKLQ